MESSSVLIAFDLDGTLNQTDKYALKAYHQTFLELGVGPFTDQQIISRFGASLEEDIHYFFNNPNQDIINQYVTILTKYWNRNLLENAQTYPHVSEVLSILKEMGYRLCICSNAPQEELHTTLQVLGINQYFDKVQGCIAHHTKADSLAHLIQIYQPIKTIMVGDRYYDYDAAKANHALFVGCQYGYGQSDELQKADYHIDNIKELLEIIKVI